MENYKWVWLILNHEFLVDTTNRGSVNAMGVGFEVEEGSISFVGKNIGIEMDLQARKISANTEILSQKSVDIQHVFGLSSGVNQIRSNRYFSLMLVGKPTSEITEAQGQTAQLHQSHLH